MVFLDRVTALIKQSHITRNRLLTELGLNKSSFVDWEKKRSTPNSQTVVKIADYFGVSTDYLLGLSDIPDRAVSGTEPEVDGVVLTSDETRLIRTYRSIDDGAMREAAANSVEGIAKAAQIAGVG